MFESIRTYQKLCKQRKCPSFWADNIIDSEKLCKNEEEQKHFYQYITNPKEYCPELVDGVATLGELEKAGLLKDDIKCHPAGFETKVYKNGQEIILHIGENNNESRDSDDEKRPE